MLRLSTIWLMVSFNRFSSPSASTVIFWLRSPTLMAVATLAILRTWLVRLAAIWLTLSVRSFQVPETPSTLACPPSLPSVPTSWATRVTSLAKALSRSTISLTTVPMRWNSPLSDLPSTLRAICCERSPAATATRTRDTSVVGLARLSISWLTELRVLLQAPLGVPRLARALS